MGHGQHKWVYPRVCGGTDVEQRLGTQYYGLSPRVRGNRQPVTVKDPVVGSIPACAGEPSIQPALCPSQGVYPRVCGEPMPE